MDDGIRFPHLDDGPGHDICPNEEYYTVEAILGEENYVNGLHYTPVSVRRSANSTFREPIDETVEAEVSKDSNINDNRKYFYEIERLKTFEKWTDSYNVSPIDLARNGFIHIGPEDRVLCVFCLKTIHDWEKGDNVQKEHLRLYPNCPFVRGKCQNVNFPISNAENLKQDFRVLHKGLNAKYPAFVEEASRLATFINWPSTNNQRPDLLAKAGFFYKPQPGKIDRVKCFMCGKILHKWSREDDPWVEHARLSRNCIFVLNERGQDFVKRCNGEAVPAPPAPSSVVQNFQPISYGTEENMALQGAVGPVSKPEDNLLKHTAVRAVLEEAGDEFTLEQVRKALEELTLSKGADNTVSSEELLTKLWDSEQLELHDIEIDDDNILFD